MPSWDNGEGACFCPSGQRAGLGAYHTPGVPGCISGPPGDVGLNADAQLERAWKAFRDPRPGAAEPTVRRAFLAGWEAARRGQ